MAVGDLAADGQYGGAAKRLDERTRRIVVNMVKQGISDEDICMMAECSQEVIDAVRNIQ